jgi:hypothetical protein
VSPLSWAPTQKFGFDFARFFLTKSHPKETESHSSTLAANSYMRCTVHGCFRRQAGHNARVTQFPLITDAVKNDFWPRREEERFKNEPVSKILIQVSSISDSIIARFRELNAACPTFSTASTLRRHSEERRLKIEMCVISSRNSGLSAGRRSSTRITSVFQWS